ncbi:MAG: hypothetical protein A4S09_07700 [Proteobacteria bacterium SG_bin7]|nr:MAG: hypothetical protein A4S09_07700 [Proteobacteria bacterium SG_bin7]
MHRITSIIILFSLVPARLEVEKGQEFIIWNVGQGLWTTGTGASKCFHFDAGGEKKYFFLIFPKLKKLCSGKNFFSFSHWDLDHLSFVGRMSGKLNSCLLNSPGGKTRSIFKKRWLENLKPCVAKHVIPEVIEIGSGKSNRTSNEASRVYIYNKKFLLPGDSPLKSEKIWSYSVPWSINFLVLGHHGSRTSTGADLLKKIPMAKMAVASSDSKRYGHPHFEVRKKLKKHGIALLETQFWGNIHIVYN